MDRPHLKLNNVQNKNINLPSINNNEQAKIKLREYLNSCKIKLWIKPYSNEDGTVGEIPLKLIEECSSKFNLTFDITQILLENLRKHSVLKFERSKKFKENGIATLFIRLASLPTQESSNSITEEFPLEISLTSSVNDLKLAISQATGLSHHRFKLIYACKPLSDESILQMTNVKNLGNILAICLTESEEGLIRSGVAGETDDSDNYDRVEKTRKATELLMDSHKDLPDEYYQLNIADQSGNILELQESERKSLTMAMMFHEKGKTALKKKNVALSLVYFLEADSQFNMCASSLLDMVDNYGLLCLDIVWCYFRLQQVSALTDAESRLQICEAKLKQTYGSNMERVTKVRGAANQETVFMLRLHLLQAILAFYKGQFDASRNLITRAEMELKSLRVDDNSMMSMMEMGFSERESRLGLRFCQGNIDQAIQHIEKERMETKNRLEKEKNEKANKKLQKFLGKTKSNELLNVELYKDLLSMGYKKGQAANSLKQSNNDIMMALQYIDDHPEDIYLPDPEIKSNNNISQSSSLTSTPSPNDNNNLLNSIINCLNNNITINSTNNIINQNEMNNVAIDSNNANEINYIDGSNNLNGINNPDNQISIQQNLLEHLSSLGIDPNLYRSTLANMGIDLEGATSPQEILDKLREVLPQELWNGISSFADFSMKSISNNCSGNGANALTDPQLNNILENQVRNKELLDSEILEAIPMDCDEYLNVTLDEEAEALYEFKAKLNSLLIL